MKRLFQKPIHKANFLLIGMFGLLILGAWQQNSQPPANSEDAIRQELYQHPDTQDGTITDMVIEGEWAKGGIIPGDIEQHLDGDGQIFIAHWQEERWHIYLEGTPAFRQILPHVPETLIISSTKYLLDYENPPPDAPVEQFTAGGGYKLPWPAGVSRYVSRAWATGTCNHAGDNSVDALMPIGSEIVAMRGGTVTTVVEYLNVCGCSSANNSNYVEITHSDGTRAQYVHIGQNQAVVNVNDVVQQGQLIAYSDQIGYTCGSGTCPSGTCPVACTPAAHLHFHVLNTSGVKLYVSFDDVGDIVGCQNYTSGNQAPCCGCTLANQNKNALTNVPLSPFAGLVPQGPASVAPLPTTTLPDIPSVVETLAPTAESREIARPPDYMPPNGRLQINGGGEVVNSLNVTLHLEAQDENRVTAMRFSADGETWTPWQSYATRYGWQLSNQTDAQTVYAQVKDEAGNISQRMEATVTAVLNVDPPSSANYTVACSVMGLGGGTAVSGSYTVRSTIGQPYDTTPMQGNSYQVHPGFETACSGENVAPITQEVYLPVVVRP